MHKGGDGWVFAHGEIDIKDCAVSVDDRESQKRRRAITSLGISSAVIFMVMVLELSTGYFIDSLALLSDGMHQVSDVALYMGLLLAVLLTGKEEDLTTYSFGYHRAQVLGALGALLMQYLATGLLVTNAVRRLTVETHEIDGATVSLVGGVAFTSNFLLLRAVPGDGGGGGHGHSHGAGVGKAGGSAWDVARLHMLGDLVQGCAVILAGAISWLNPAYTWADPASTFVYAGIVLLSSWAVFVQLVTVLMERAPLELDVQGLFDDLSKLKGVIDVHCYHVWALAPEKVSMSAHLHIEDDMHEEVLHAAQILVKHKYGIVHSTLQVSEDEDLA